MTLQVEGTNDSSCLSKYSATQKGYFRDGFLQYFVSKCPRRAPLIHLGYSVRAAIINTLVEEFVDTGNSLKQIVSMGAGFDTLFFKLKKKNCSKDVIYYELDLPRVVERKIKCIEKSDALKNTIGDFIVNENGLFSKEYKLLAVDLRDLEVVDGLLSELDLDPDRPTFFLSECAITYLEEEKSTNLIKFASSFNHATFVTYEQIHPDDGFGLVMLQHFASLQSPLMSVKQYPTLDLQSQRYTNHNWNHCTCVSALDAYKSLIPDDERSRVLRLEPFDEWEEFYLKCVHYAVVIASKGSLSDWSRLCRTPVLHREISQKEELIWNLVESRGTCRYGHSVVLFKDQLLLIGGFGIRKDGTHGRMKEIVWLERDNLRLKISQETEASDFATMYSSWTAVLNGNYIVYGGRTSPTNCVFTCPQLVIFQSDRSVRFESLVEICDRPARWRHSAVVAEKDGVETFIVFGGRTSNLKLLSDTWMVPLLPDVNDRKVMGLGDTLSRQPCPRFSHSAAVRSTNTRCDEMWIHGGHGGAGPLADVWCLDMRSQQWRELEVVGGCIPRFGHSTSILRHTLVVVGGVSGWEDGQPPVSVLDLETSCVVHYKLPVMSPGNSMLLINHCHIVCDDEKALYIIGGGGNCFSFGTFFNSSCSVIKLKDLNL